MLFWAAGTLNGARFWIALAGAIAKGFTFYYAWLLFKVALLLVSLLLAGALGFKNGFTVCEFEVADLGIKGFVVGFGYVD